MSMLRTLLVPAGASLLLAACSSAESSASETSSAMQALEQGGECLIGDETIEHACLHATSGPFASVTAQPYPGFVFSDVNAPHTVFNVGLPAAGSGSQGGVLYQPTASGEFGILQLDGTSLAVYDSARTLVTPVGSAPGNPELCAAISQLSVYALSDTETYTIVLGPSASATASLVVEYLGPEAACEGDCEPVTLVASRQYRPSRWTDAEHTFEVEAHFELPIALPVTEGVASGFSVLTYSAEGSVAQCAYRGNSGTNYVFLGCSNGAQAGDEVHADYVKLRVHGGLSCSARRIKVELTLEPECGGHDEEEH